MFIIKKLILFLFVFNISLIISLQNYTEMQDIIHQSNLLSDRIIFLFNEYPTSIFEPQKQSHQNLAVAVFLMPYTRIQKKVLNKVQQLFMGNKKYRIKLENIVKPIEGIRIYITYDPSVLKLDYAPSDSIGYQKGMVINLHNKKIVQAINDKSCPLRWHA